MKKLEYSLKYLIIFFILIGSYLTLMTLSSIIPSSFLQENVKKSSETLFKDDEKKTYELGYKDETIFTFTDALMINTAYSIDSNHPIKSFILARKNYIPAQTKIEYIDSQYNLGASPNYKNAKTGDIYQTKELYGLMHGENIEESFEYARYWHGYLVILRPLLVFFSYTSIRIILFILTLILMITMLVLIAKKIDMTTAVIYALALLCINIFVVSQSMNEILVFIVAFISTIILLIKKNKIKDFFVFFFVIGSITNFIDFLTAPIVTLGIVGTTYFLLLQKEKKNRTIKEMIKQILMISIAWALGYALTWSAKWIITQVFFDRNLISQAIEQAFYRMKLPTNTQTKFTIITVLYQNLQFLSFPVVYFIAILASIFMLFHIIKKKEKISFQSNIKDAIPYFTMFFLPIAWYFVLQEHSLIHAFFTYRILVVSILNLFIILKTLFKTKD